MWTEWLGRTLGARSTEDYVKRRARRYADDGVPAGDRGGADRKAPPDPAAPHPARDGY
jgi:hypothetical protein